MFVHLYMQIPYRKQKYTRPKIYCSCSL